MIGKYLVLEGIDGSGTSTLLSGLQAALESAGIRVHFAAQPSDHGAGVLARSYLRQPLHEEFERAALDLGTAGDISGPVRTRYGYHLIRLDGRTPPRPQAFAEVRSRLIQTVKKDHEANIRAQAMRRAQEHPMVAQPEAVEKMLKRYFGDELEGAPNFNQ